MGVMYDDDGDEWWEGGRVLYLGYGM